MALSSFQGFAQWIYRQERVILMGNDGVCWPTRHCIHHVLNCINHCSYTKIGGSCAMGLQSRRLICASCLNSIAKSKTVIFSKLCKWITQKFKVMWQSNTSEKLCDRGSDHHWHFREIYLPDVQGRFSPFSVRSSMLSRWSTTPHFIQKLTRRQTLPLQ